MNDGSRNKAVRQNEAADDLKWITIKRDRNALWAYHTIKAIRPDLSERQVLQTVTDIRTNVERVPALESVEQPRFKPVLGRA